MIGVDLDLVRASGSPGCLPTLQYAADVAAREKAVLVAEQAQVQPGGDLAERRYPSPYPRKMWADAAIGRLEAALRAAWGSASADVVLQPMVVRGVTGDVLVRCGRVARLGHGRVSRFCLAHTRCLVLASLAAAPAGGRLRPWSQRWELAAREEPTEQHGEQPRREVR